MVLDPEALDLTAGVLGRMKSVQGLYWNLMAAVGAVVVW